MIRIALPLLALWRFFASSTLAAEPQTKQEKPVQPGAMASTPKLAAVDHLDESALAAREYRDARCF